MILSEGKNVTCEFSYETYDSIGKVYQCKLKVEIDVSNKTIENALGSHLPPNSDSDVQFLFFIWFKGDRIPEGFGRIFPNILGILGTKNGLKELTVDDLKAFKHLKYLKFNDNQLRTLKSDLFSGNPDLQYVDFSQNELSYVGANIFDSLSNLSYVNLNHNYLLLNISHMEENTTRGIEGLKKNLTQKFNDEPKVYYLKLAEEEETCKPLTSLIEELKTKECSQLIIWFFVYLIIDLAAAVVYLTCKLLSLINVDGVDE